MKKRILLFAIGLLVSTGVFAQLQPTGRIGLYTDEGHSYPCTEGVGFYSVEMWIWCLPSERGQMCAEFMIEYPPNVIPSTVTHNPEIISIILGWLPDGVSVCYIGCQWDWNWPFHQTLWVADPSKTSVEVVAHPDVGTIQFANCEPGYPVEQVYSWPMLYINYTENDLECIDWIFPVLTNVDVISPVELDALFDQSVEAPSAVPEKFVLYNAVDISDTLQIIDVDIKCPPEYPCCNGGDVLTMFLATPMTAGENYILEANAVCGFGFYGCGDSEIGFYNEPIATLLKSSSVTFRNSTVSVRWELSGVDEDIRYYILRADSGSMRFEELSEPFIQREGLRFLFEDNHIEPGETYRYRVAYIVGERRVVLFETDPVSTPELPLTLYQNVPNPFNPVTEISYYLPENTRVTLEIYDVTGRMVRCLVDRCVQRGRHSIGWNGRDDSGAPAASGVYFYRLRAGKEMVSRKMLLLR